MSEFWGFFKDRTEQSMMRLISFSMTSVVVILALYSGYLVYQEKFTTEWGVFLLSLLAAAIGGKNWSKKLEGKKNEDNNI